MSIQCIRGPFDSKVLGVILGSFSAFPIFDNLVSQKTGDRRAKWSEIWASGIQCIHDNFGS